MKNVLDIAGRIRRRGFTLLEVIVSVAILGLSLTAIFASESGSLRTATRARHTHLATILARCKMGEIEEFVSREGFPMTEESGEDGCCEDAEIDGYKCDWSITPITLPSGVEAQPNASGSSGARRPGASNDPNDVAGRALGQIGTAGDFLAGGGDRGGLEAMLLQIALPILNPAIEGQVRRVTVNVHWKEGSRDYGFDVSQFLVNEDQPNVEVVRQAIQGATGATGGQSTGARPNP